LRRYSRYRRQTVQQDQGQDKIQQEILQIKETYGTAGSGAGQNTAGGSPGRGHRQSSRTGLEEDAEGDTVLYMDRPYSRTRARTTCRRKYSR
jgi:hypothetical protein